MQFVPVLLHRLIAQSLIQDSFHQVDADGSYLLRYRFPFTGRQPIPFAQRLDGSSKACFLTFVEPETDNIVLAHYGQGPNAPLTDHVLLALVSFSFDHPGLPIEPALRHLIEHLVQLPVECPKMLLSSLPALARVFLRLAPRRRA